jgi:hypothetical protein
MLVERYWIPRAGSSRNRPRIQCQWWEYGPCGGKPCFGRRAADGPVQLGGAQPMKEGMPSVKLNHAHGAGVGVGKDGFTAEVGNDLW